MLVRQAVFVFVMVACIAAHAAILVSVVRRASAAPAAPVPRPRLVAEIVWALIPAVVLAFVLTATWAKVREPLVEPPGVLLKVAR